MKKILTVVLVFLSILCFSIPCFADDVNSQTITPISVSGMGGDTVLTAFPGASSVSLFYNGVQTKSFLDNADYNGHSTRVLAGQYYGQTVNYFRLYLSTNYSSVYFNGNVYNSNTDTSSVFLVNVTSIDIRPVSSSYTQNTYNTFWFNIILGDYPNIEEIFNDGFNAGVNSNNAKDKWYQEGFDEGFIEGQTATEGEALAQNLLGDTLSMPFRALDNVVLFETSTGVPITLLTVFKSVLAISLLIVFLKLFAGG